MLTSMEGQTVRYDRESNLLLILDQTLLPHVQKILYLDDAEAIWEAIRSLRVRGAPAIGVAAAIGLAVLAQKIPTASRAEFDRRFAQAAEYLTTARPTAVNLFWAAERMQRVLRECAVGTVAECKMRLAEEAERIHAEDIAACRALGQYGAALIHDGDGILTHCNAGRLAAIQYGTALAPIYMAQEQGKRLHVWADETRPLLQGARLTAFELQEAGIPVTLQCDNMAASIMATGKIQAVFVGADRIAANGDTANKIGTLGVAVLARYFEIPFYVCAPCSTIDRSLPDGQGIPIEQRTAEEVTQMWYAHPMAPKQIAVENPAFDVTPHTLISAIVTERGIARPPFLNSIGALFGQTE